MGWLDEAACRDVDPEWFFPMDTLRAQASQQGVERVREVCRSCPVSSSCLEWALATRQRHGLWAGTTPQERSAMLAGSDRRRASRPRVSPGSPRRAAAGGAL